MTLHLSRSLVPLALLAGCGRGDRREGHDEAAVSARVLVPALPRPGTLSLPARVKAVEEATLTARSVGRISGFGAREGQAVAEGAAFAVVLVLIYLLTVGWFKSFVTPLVIMLPIPLSLVGILPAHALVGAFFTATSMIGFIAGAGITVRNSIILVDFIELRRAQGQPLREAVIEAGAVRFRPMVLTAAAVVVGGGVILFDPSFQGLAVAGAVAPSEPEAALWERHDAPAAELYRRGEDRDRAGPADRGTAHAGRR